MTENTVESGQEPGAEELPKPSYQEQPAAEPTSPATQSSVTLSREDLESLIDATVEKKVQSTKDKRWSNVEKQYGKLSDLQKTLEEAGADPAKSEKILEARRIQQLEERIEQLSSSQPAPIPGKSEADEAYEKVKGIISQAELNNNPRILEALSATYKDPSEMSVAVTSIVLEEVTGKPQATEASKVTPSSSKPSGTLTQQQAEQALSAELENLNPDPEAIRAAAKQMEE
jgi:hypothetical protein